MGRVESGEQKKRGYEEVLQQWGDQLGNVVGFSVLFEYSPCMLDLIYLPSHSSMPYRLLITDIIESIDLIVVEPINSSRKAIVPEYPR